MHLASSLLFLASLPAAFAGKGHNKPAKGLHTLAREAGLKYFGAATDSPGQRERAGHEDAYPQYDQIMWKSGEFGQTTPTNGQKVSFLLFKDHSAITNSHSGRLSAPRRASGTTRRVTS